MGVKQAVEEKSFETEKLTKRQLPEVLEVRGLRGKDKLAVLLDEAADIKAVLNKNVPDDEYDPKVHLARRYEEIKDELAMVQQTNDLDGIRHNNVVFSARLQKGRVSVPIKDFKEALLERGVKAAVVTAAEDEARKEGEAFWVREIEVLQ